MPLSECPNVIVDPRIAFGRPVIAPQFVPTEALFALWKAEDGNYRAIADWFHISRDQAEEAVEFEVRLAISRSRCSGKYSLIPKFRQLPV